MHACQMPRSRGIEKEENGDSFVLSSGMHRVLIVLRFMICWFYFGLISNLGSEKLGAADSLVNVRKDAAVLNNDSCAVTGMKLNFIQILFSFFNLSIHPTMFRFRFPRQFTCSPCL